jgi:Uma2 family endonuclease
MSIAADPKLMTAEEFLALPEDGKDRWLIRGQLRDKPMTYRNRTPSRIMARLTIILGNWLDRQPVPRGEILCGDAGVRLHRNPDSVVGIDVAYVSADVAGRDAADTTLIDGPPVLAVEIPSPSDRIEEIDEKTDAYLGAGVAIIWVIDPHDRTVTIYRPGHRTETFNDDQELEGDPHLPGFRVKVADLFA